MRTPTPAAQRAGTAPVISERISQAHLSTNRIHCNGVYNRLRHCHRRPPMTSLLFSLFSPFSCFSPFSLLLMREQKYPTTEDASADPEEAPAKRPKTCQCGSTSHSRIPCKACPLYRPRLAQADEQDGSAYTTSTVKCALLKLSAKPSLAIAIENAAARMTAVSFEAAELANTVVCYLLERFEDPPVLDQTFIRRIFEAVCSRKSSMGAANKVRCEVINRVRDHCYDPTRPPKLAWIDSSHLGQIITNAAKMYMTNCQNHIALNLEHRVRIWIRHKLCKKLDMLSVNEINSLDNGVWYALSHSCTATLPRFVAGMTPERRLLVERRYHHVVQRLRSLFGQLSVGEADVKAEWWRYLKPLHRILRCFEKHGRRCAESGQGGKKGLKLFTLLPLHSYQWRHFLLDTNALYDLYSSIGFADHSRVTLRDFRENALLWWRRAFHIDTVTTSRRKFAFSLQTDGVAASVLLRRVAEGDNEDAESSADSQFTPLSLTEDCRVVGLDPGRRELFVAMDQSGKVIRCSTQEYYHLAGFKQAEKKRKGWLDRDESLQAIVRATPTAACSSVVGIQAHLRHVLPHLPELIAFYGEKRWRRLRFGGYVNRQKGLHGLCQPLTDGDPATVIAFGDATFFSSSRGHAAGPVRLPCSELRKKMLGAASGRIQR